MSLQAPLQPGTMRMASGRIVPISRSASAAQVKLRKLLIVIQHYDGDAEAAEELAVLIADLERTRNRLADVLLMRRGDSRELSSGVQTKLAAKFDKVLLHACRRSDAKGYPMGSNQMFFDLAALMAHEVPYREDYYAFLNLEADCVPVRPGWIKEIADAYQSAAMRGKVAIGYIHDNPSTHLNGVAAYSTDLARKVRMIGCGPKVCYDVAQGRLLAPLSDNSSLFRFRYRQATITAAELFAPQEDGQVPAIHHGVKDGTARAAVKARHITFTEAPAAIIVHKPDPSDTLQVSKISDPLTFSEPSDSPSVVDPLPPRALDVIADWKAGDHTFPSGLGDTIQRVDSVTLPATTPDIGVVAKRPNVYTYSNKVPGVSNAEQAAIIEAWRKGWTSRGWNPLVLTIRDAAKHPRYDEFNARIEKLPHVGNRTKAVANFNRWLALDVAGGGLMVDWDVLPADFTPENSGLMNAGPVVLDRPGSPILGAFLQDGADADWVSSIIGYDAQETDTMGGKPHVTDTTIMERSLFPSGREWPLVRFEATTKERASVAMEKFLEGK